MTRLDPEVTFVNACLLPCQPVAFHSPRGLRPGLLTTNGKFHFFLDHPGQPRFCPRPSTHVLYFPSSLAHPLPKHWSQPRIRASLPVPLGWLILCVDLARLEYPLIQLNTSLDVVVQVFCAYAECLQSL